MTRANARQTGILFPKVAEFKIGPVRDGLLTLTKEQPDENLGQLDRVRLGRRRANAAITLLRQGNVMPSLKHCDFATFRKRCRSL